jgi:hypothetical protein
VANEFRYTISQPVSTALPRDRITNTVHFQHVTGGIVQTDHEQMCSDLIAMYQAHYGNLTHEVQCKAYDVGPVPNYPLADVVVNAGSIWPNNHPREVAICLSFAGTHRGNKSERGRIYLMPGINTNLSIDAERPSTAVMDWALAFYTQSNQSFPDIGGPDWKFGIWSRTYNKFTQSQQAWCNDDWDHVSRRSLRESTRVSANREG